MTSILAVRNEPVQKRSAERITALLNAAAELIDEHGIDGLRTSDVAVRSGSSIGVVYRYFPNIQSLLRGLAARNMAAYTRLVGQAFASHPSGWMSALDASIDAYVDLNRNEPGFRALRFGDVIDERFVNPELNNTAMLARTFATHLTEKYGIANTPELRFDLEIVIDIANALLHRAFLYEKRGDPVVINRLRELVREQLGKYEPAAR
jgi:AcrR family transcriptional regulator